MDAQLLEYKPQVEEVVEHGVKQSLETSALGLTFRVRASHVGVGLRLECTASIGSVYWQSFQVIWTQSYKQNFSVEFDSMLELTNKRSSYWSRD